MTPSEALATFDPAFPADGHWGRFRERRAEAQRLLETVRGDDLTALSPELWRRLVSCNDVSEQAALALPLAREALEAGSSRFLEHVARASFRNPYFEALARLATLGTDTWSLLEALALHADVSESDVASRVTEQLTPERLTTLLARRPEVGVRACRELRWWKGKELGPFVPQLVEFVLRASDTALRVDAVRLLVGELDHDERLEALFAQPLPMELASALAGLLARQAVSQRRVPRALLTDARAEVRLAALVSFTDRDRIPRSALATVIAALADDDRHVHELAERTLRRFTEGEALGTEELEALLPLRARRTELDAFLSWAATRWPPVRDFCLARLAPDEALFKTLSAAATLACTTCLPLGRGASWSHPVHRPKAFLALKALVDLETSSESCTSLLRCDECFAYFLLFTSSEIDVNSRRDDWSLSRLRGAELGRYAPHVELTHQAKREAAARSDLTHVDPAVRTLAEWELSS